MFQLSNEEIKAILLGTELSGNENAINRLSYAVPNSLLGVAHGGNNSGFSFGIIQLDIGTNDLAKTAYTAILDDALNDNIIDQTQYSQLIQYKDNSRYDIPGSGLESTYASDRTFLNNEVFSREDAHDIIDQFTDQDIQARTIGKVQSFLDTMTETWGQDSVFEYSSDDYHTAMAAIVSVVNRTNSSLTDTKQYFKDHQPKSIDVVKAWFIDLIVPTFGAINPSDWDLIKLGGQEYKNFDERYEGVSSTISLASATQILGIQDVDDVAELFLKSELGNRISDVNYTGSGNAAFLVDEFSIPGVFDLSGGIFLSTGGLPGSSNTSSGFTVSHNTSGDTDLSNTAKAAFSGAGITRDASVLEFKTNIVGDVIDGISFDIVFGSDEYPEFSNSSFVDIAAIYVNGINVALFNDDLDTPLSVIQPNVSSGNFLDNTSGIYATEWDGFSNKLTVRAALIEGENTIKIGIADTGDTILDSGLYVNNIEYLTQGGTGGGVLNIIDGDDGDNTLLPSLKKEEINLFNGQDNILGTPSELNGDIVTGFGTDDVLTFKDVLFGINDLTITFGSAILDIDTDQNGSVDTTVILEGNFEEVEFNVNQVEGNTEITVSEKSSFVITGTFGRDNLIGTSANDVIKSLGGNVDRMTGGEGGDIFVFGSETTNGVRERDIILDYEVGIDSIQLEDGATVGSIRQTSSGVTVFFEGDRDAVLVQGEGVLVGNLTFVPEDILLG